MVRYLTLQTKITTKGRILTPRSRFRKTRIVDDPLTGLPALTAGPDAAPLSSKQVEEILASFP
jgi:hypothetical protein